jgi:HAD superfamily hydrolase (TIGR01509 family)
MNRASDGGDASGTSASELPAAVVFDFDGLVLDTEQTTYDTVNEVFVAHGQELSLELWTGFIGTTDHPHWTDLLEAQLGRPFDRDTWQARRAETGLARAMSLELLPGVGSLMEELHDAGVSMAVASSSSADWVHGHLRHRRLDRLVEAVCTGDEVERTKPDPALYLLACERLGVAPAMAVAIEDSLHGIAAARSAGMRTVAVPGRMTAHLDYSIADLVVASCDALDLARLAALVVVRS